MCKSIAIERIEFGEVVATNFTICTIDELKIVLELRNSDEVRNWMFTQHKITLDEHLAFVESLKNRSDKLYFLIKDENGYVGVVYFTDLNLEKKEAYIGLYANHQNPQKQKGTKLMYLIEKIAKEELKLQKLLLEVFKTNTRAMELYLKNGFERVSSKGESELFAKDLEQQSLEFKKGVLRV